MEGEGRQLEVGYTFHWDTDSSAVSSTSDKNRHSPQGRSRQLLAAVWHPMQPYLIPQWLHRPSSAPLWTDRVGKKPSVKADLAVYTYDTAQL